MSQRESGFCYLCSILGEIYQEEHYKKLFQEHAKSGAPMSKEHVHEIIGHLTTLAHKLEHQNEERGNMLTDVLNRYHAVNDEQVNTDLLCGKKVFLENAFIGLFIKQKSARNDVFAGLAWVIAMAAGVTEGPFYVGSNELRRLLRRSLGCIGFQGIDFVPEHFFSIPENDKRSDTPDDKRDDTSDNKFDDLLKLLVLSLYGSMKTKLPYKNPEMQRKINYQRSHESILNLIRDNPDSEFLSGVEYAGEAAKICGGIRNCIRELTRTELLPDQTSLNVEKFYTLPLFEPEEAKSCCSRYFMQKDLGGGVRSMVIGDRRSGKTLLAKVTAHICLEDLEKQSAFSGFCAEQMGLGNTRYEVLMLDCARLSRDFHENGQNLIAEALDQMVHQAMKTRYAGQLLHWNDHRSQVLSYYTYLAEQSEVLLIVENLSSLKNKELEMIVSCLEAYDRTGCGQLSKINLLITTRRLPRSVLNRFSGYNRVQIASLPVEQTVRKLVEAGVGCHDAQWYMKLNDDDWMLQEFLKASPEHLIRLLCEFDGQKLDMDVLIRQSIQEHLEQASSCTASAEDCEALLTDLAVALVEKHDLGRYQEISPCGSRSKFRKNCINAACLREIWGSSEAAGVWQHIQEQQLLLSHGPISSYQFSCRLFACSLVADRYLELLRTGARVNWLERFQRIHAEDMAVIARMVTSRIFCCESGLLDISQNNRSYDLQLFLQSLAAYTVSLRTLSEVFQMLRTLSDILDDSRMEAGFRDCNMTHMWNMLKRVYWERYDCYGNCWGMDVSALRKPTVDILVKA